MPSIRSLFVFVSIVTTVACVPPPPLSPQAVALTPGFERAESAVYAATLGVWLVSNIGGNTPGDGFVSSVDATGRLLESRFVEGLDDPKGLALDGDTLYVADLTTLVRVQLDSPSTHEAIPIEGSVFLNDVAVDPASHAVYVSDTFGNAIYRVRGAESELLISDAALEAPNGLWVEQGGLLIGSIGPDLDTTTFQPRAPGRILHFDLRTRRLSQRTERFGGVDGIARLDSTRFLVTDTFVGVYVWTPGEAPELVIPVQATGLGTTADIGIDHAGGRLLIPDVLGTEVAMYTLF